MLNKNQREILKTANYLDLTPDANYESERNEKGLIDVLAPRFKNNFAKKYILPKMRDPYIRANLDEFGSETWALIDGKRTVRDISFELLRKFGDKIEPVNERLTTFLSQLFKFGFITFNELKGN